MTVSATVVEAVMVPEVPVIVMGNVPPSSVPSPVRVTTLLDVVVAGVNDAVTPAGRPEAAKLTIPVNPYNGVTVTVELPDAVGAMVKALGEDDSVKLGG